MDISSAGLRFAIAAAAAASLATGDPALGILRNRAPTAASESGPTLYERAVEAAEDDRCRDALPLVEEALAETPDDADAHALAGFCRRKTGELDEAFASYRHALELRPEFPEARQYLGEAHVQAVLREIAILRGYGESGREELDALVAALREATAQAEGSGVPSSARHRVW
jgi:tetratricopeptide (TPR) repeat protein